MDAVFDAHYRIVQDQFSRRGINLEVAYTPNGEPDYIYERGRLLVAAPDVNLGRLRERLDGAEIVERGEELAVVSIEHLRHGFLSVPDALDLLDPIFHGDLPFGPGVTPLISPNHLFHVERLCSAIEPEVPGGSLQPWPPPREPADDEQPVRIGLVDTGLIKPVDAALTWLSAGVDGEDDPLITVLPGGLRLIPPFTGHGTFVAGVVRCMAPQSEIFVGNELNIAGATLESKIVGKIEQVAARFQPAILNVSSGTYTRNDWNPIAFEEFFQHHPDLTLVAAAGNDSTDRPLFPAAFPFPGVVSVGALGPDQAHLAWFSNYGQWVDVYALGEGIVNAFAVGQYRYHEPPKQPARQDFLRPLARWSGTSFAAPLVTGMIAARMGRTGEPSRQAAEALLTEAGQNAIHGVGPVLPAPPTGA
jgi:subtilisin family serine protease